MLGVPLDKRVRRTLAVEVGAGLAVTLDAKASAYFPAHLAQPSGDNSLLDGAPRTSLSVWRLYWGVGGPTVHACDRIEVPGDATYELISKPREISNGRRLLGYSAPVLPVELLYPRSGEVKEKGGAKVGDIECALYSERDETRSRGEYAGSFMDAPPSAFDPLTGARNREAHFSDGSVWTVIEATRAPELPFVSASVRKIA